MAKEKRFNKKYAIDENDYLVEVTEETVKNGSRTCTAKRKSR